jgi:aspartyl-tRNA(Asn)/glutamyl-tRNA(Gln) amidotransferase subunit A
VELAGEVAGGRRSVATTVEEALVALQGAQARLNACTFIDEDGARARAAELDRQIAAGGETGPLAGVPIVVKDLIDQAGRTTTCGSSFYRQVPERSAPVVERLEAAGAVIVGRAGLHEFAYGFSSENHWFGPVRNPWDPSTSPGGSSGGSAVAVAAGLVPASVGTDTGGSVRVPAALTGICGLKVTYGRIPLRGVFPLAPSLDTVGPLAATVADLDLMYRVMAAVPSRSERRSWRGVRIGLPRQWLAGPTQPAVAEGFEQALAALSSLGGRLVEIDDPELTPWGMIQELAGAEAAHVHHRFREEGRIYGEEVGQRLDAAAQVGFDQYLEAISWRGRLQESFVAAFSGVDLIATPAVAALRKEIGNDRIDGQHYRPVLSWFSALVNHGGVPAIALPVASATRPPVSLQLIGPWWEEDLLLSLAATAEREGLVRIESPDPQGDIE